MGTTTVMYVYFLLENQTSLTPKGFLKEKEFLPAVPEREPNIL